ncbi:MAG: PKD domain-containing protein [Bacteroidetes bacterium]|nr:PKD domain-containing protein [Bacteroidota bacterium]
MSQRKYLIAVCALFLFLFAGRQSFAQIDVRTIDMNKVNQDKVDGKLNGTERYVNYQANPNPFPFQPGGVSRNGSNGNSQSSAFGCNCWIPRDASWQICEFDGSGGSGGPGVAPDYRNDDWSTVAIILPFQFCLYGRNIDTIFINNNGNVSVDAPYSTFSADTFASPNFVMIAPFWGDVDTRGATSGLVYYTLTPTHLIVQWEDVGYFSSHTDLLNTFQLIMTDGNDPILGPGANVSFCYKDMQWTTGDASGGSGGFGGTAATVGVNLGNGTDFFQVGLFDQLGGAYDGPNGARDGIDALDNQSFIINACNSGSNVPPIINSLQACDTLKVCLGDTLIINANYLSPEPTQVTTASVSSLMTGITTLAALPGNIAFLSVQIIGLPSNLGMNLIDLRGTDNGVPARTTITHVVIQVLQSPTASYTYAPLSPITAGTNVTFTNTSTGTGATYSWNFGDGSLTSALQNPTHTYSTGGTYDCVLTVTNANGCQETFTQQIVVTQCGTASLTTTNVCQGTGALITYTGTPAPAGAFAWNFHGGTVVSGTGAGPYTVTWNTSGTFNVDVTVTQAGCGPVTATQAITIFATPTASITATAALCTGQINTINFNGTAGAGAGYAWNFAGGNVSSGSGSGPYSVQWSTAGNYQLQLIVTENGCRDTATFAVLVNAIPTSPFTATPSVCAGSPVTVTYTGNAPAAANYTWGFDGGTIVAGSGQGPYTLVWNSAGSHQLSLTVAQNGCTSTPSNATVTVNPIPNASITATPAVCVGQSNAINFNGTAGAGAGYTWNFGSGTVGSGSGSGPYAVSWNTAGAQQVQVVVTENGCRDTAVFAVQVNAIPTSSFTVTPSVCAGSPVAVNYTGTAAAGSGYTWNFNGATVASGAGQGPYSLVWNSAGAYTVSLTVTENGCVSAPSSRPVTINAIPDAAIGATPAVCIGQANTINFTGTALAGASYSWSFGTGTVNSGSGAGPYSVQWGAAGNEPLKVIVTQNGCTDSAFYNVVVYPIPTSAFILPANACIGEPFAVTYNGTGIPASTYAWNFGNASLISGSGQGPYMLVSQQAGNPSISLTVTQNGCVSPPTAHSINIVGLPVANAGIDKAACSGATVALGSANVAGNTYQWTPSNGLTDPTLANPGCVVTNLGAGTNSAAYILTVTSSFGCVNMDTVVVQAHAIPAAIYDPLAPQCLKDNSFLFKASGNIFSGVTYDWNFGAASNPGSSTQQNPDAVTYSSVGTHYVTLKSTYNGCPGPNYTDSVVVLAMPVADFVPEVLNGCEPLEVPFINASSSNSASFSWNYFDGQSDTVQTPLHTFEHAGVYSVSLISTTAEGCRADTLLPDLITVYPTPIASFVPEPGVTTIWQPVIYFDNNTVHGNQYQWIFGDSSGSELKNPSHTYTEVGAYEVVLMTSTQYGCRDTVRGIVRIEYGFNFYVPTAFTPNNDGVNDYFQGYGTYIKLYDMGIYNRWGLLIYHTTDYSKPWDGKISQEVQSDVYVYKIRVVDQNDEVHNYIGKVTVVR